MFKINKNLALLGIAVLGVVITGVLVFVNSTPNFSNAISFLNIGKSKDAIAKDAVDYINKNLLQGGQSATLKGVSDDAGLVKIQINIAGKDYNTFVSKDGKYLFPYDPIQIDQKAAAGADNSNQQNQTADQGPTKQTCDSLAKTDKPLIQTFVVSRCPFGLQMQRAMAQAISASPDFAKDVNVRYIGSVSSDGKTIISMHGDAEAQENLRQICIRNEQGGKYWNYVSCQMKNGDTAGCEKTAGIDSSKLSACISDPKRGVAFAKEDFDLANKFGVQGSPTLIMGDKKVSEFDFGGRSAEALKTMICCSSKTQPGFCSSKFDTNEAATSFSLTYANTNSGSSGNSGTTGANCAPAQ